MEYIEGGWPGSNPRDAEFFRQWPQLLAAQLPEAEAQTRSGGQAASAGSHAGQAKLAAFGSTRYKNTTCEEDANVAALLACNAPVVTLVAKVREGGNERTSKEAKEHWGKGKGVRGYGT